MKTCLSRDVIKTCLCSSDVMTWRKMFFPVSSFAFPHESSALGNTKVFFAKLKNKIFISVIDDVVTFVIFCYRAQKIESIDYDKLASNIFLQERFWTCNIIWLSVGFFCGGSGEGDRVWVGNYFVIGLLSQTITVSVQRMSGYSFLSMRSS